MSFDERKLLFDEYPDYLDLSKSEQKEYFKKKMSEFNDLEKKERVRLKIEKHKNIMSGGLKPKPKTKEDHEKKRKNQWNLDDSSNKSSSNKSSSNLNERKKNELKKDVMNENNNDLEGKNVKYYSGAEKKKPKIKKKKKYQEEGQTIKTSTKKNDENSGVLNYVEEEEKEEDEINKNSRIQLDIKESNKKLKEKMKKVTEYSFKGYSNLKKRDVKDDNISRIGNITYQRNVLIQQQKKLNPSLIIEKNKKIAEISKKKNNSLIQDSVNIINPRDNVKVLKWHEQRLNDYIDIINIQKNQIDNLKKLVLELNKNVDSLYYNSIYKDINIIKLHDKSIRKIQSTWRFYKFRISYNAIKLQRWYRYIKNVKNVANEVEEFIVNISNIKKQTTDISKFLSSFNSKQALPLERLREIQKKLFKQQEVLDM